MDCLHLGVPDVRIEGSDLAELLAWSCFALPGLLYAAWRHADRYRVCTECRSARLVYEPRAAARRRPLGADGPDGPRILTEPSRVVWPRALRTPGQRVRRGGVAASLLGRVLATQLFDAPPQLSLASALAGASGLGFQLREISRTRRALPACAAWDQNGRPLRIERA